MITFDGKLFELWPFPLVTVGQFQFEIGLFICTKKLFKIWYKIVNEMEKWYK